MLKFKRSALVSAIAVAAILLTSGSAFAAPGQNGRYLYGDAITDMGGPNAAAYVESGQGDASANVTLVVEAGNHYNKTTMSMDGNPGFRKVYNKNISSSSPSGVTVKDLLDAVHADNQGVGGELTFGINGNENTNMYFLYSVSKDNIAWSTGDFVFSGWVFRVNDKFPVRMTADGGGYEGTSISQTYLHDGDIVRFFFDYPAELAPGEDNIAAYNVRGVYRGRTGNKTKIQVQGHRTWIDQSDPYNYIMNVFNYFDLTAGNMASNTSVLASQLNVMFMSPKLIAADGAVYNGSMNIGGTATFTNVPAGEYIFTTESQLNSFDEDSGWVLIDGAFLCGTGAYNKVQVQ